MLIEPDREYGASMIVSGKSFEVTNYSESVWIRVITVEGFKVCVFLEPEQLEPLGRALIDMAQRLKENPPQLVPIGDGIEHPIPGRDDGDAP